MDDNDQWPQRPPPVTEGEAWEWEISSVTELSVVRAELRVCAYLAGHPQPVPGVVDDRLILAVDELAADLLVHGSALVCARVAPMAGGWLVNVAHRNRDGPAPSVRRFSFPVGPGLNLVARVTSRRGWTADAEGTRIWVYLASGDDRPRTEDRPRTSAQPSLSRATL